MEARVLSLRLDAYLVNTAINELHTIECKHTIQNTLPAVITVTSRLPCVFCENERLRVIYEAAKAFSASIQTPCDPDMCLKEEYELRQLVAEAVASAL